MNKREMKKTSYYESPLVLRVDVELEQIMSASGTAKVKVSADANSSTQEDWQDVNTGGNYDIDM